MKNAYFNNSDLSVMLSGGLLNIISSIKSDITTTSPSQEYLNWINKNCDCHHHREAMLVLSGSGYFSLNDYIYPCQTGNFFLIDSEEKHDLCYPPFYDAFRHLWFRIINKTIFTNNPYSKTNGKDAHFRTFTYTFDEHNYAGQLFINAWNRFVSNQATDSEFDWLYLKNAVSILLLELCKAGNDALLEKAEQPIELHHKTVIETVKEHIKKTGGKNLDIARLAYIAGYSKFHFARLFKKITGFSVLEFINLSRVDKYKELSSIGFNKKQIADKLGFSSPAAFSRWLKDNLSQ